MQQRLDERGDQLAIVDEFGEWTWADFNDRVNWHFSAEEIAYVLENSGATVVVGDAEFAEAVTEAVAAAGTRVRISLSGPDRRIHRYEPRAAVRLRWPKG